MCKYFCFEFSHRITHTKLLKQVHLLYHMLEGFSLRRSNRGGVGWGRVGAVCTQRSSEAHRRRPESPALFCFHSDR